MIGLLFLVPLVSALIVAPLPPTTTAATTRRTEFPRAAASLDDDAGEGEIKRNGSQRLCEDRLAECGRADGRARRGGGGASGFADTKAKAPAAEPAPWLKALQQDPTPH